MASSPDVVLQWQSVRGYDGDIPYHPPVAFPEYPFFPHLDSRNEVYRTVRNALIRLKYDAEHYDMPSWNPLGGVVRPGDTIVIKPNLIAGSQSKNGNWHGLITHGSVLRAVIDYVFIALKRRGRIIIADAPQEDSDIKEIKQRIGMNALQAFYREVADFPLEFLDLRGTYRRADNGVYVETVQLPGDPDGTVKINLDDLSYFQEVDAQSRRYYGAFYDVEETNRHHRQGTHEYLISRTALSADAFISVPKLKTHKKVGITLNLKGLVGINGQKNWLPHYAIGSPDQGGDQFNRANVKTRAENALVLSAKKLLKQNNPPARALARALKKTGYRLFGATDTVVRSGNWHGNDTCWRMTLDLNRILLWFNGDGTPRLAPRRYFSIVDGIIGMEGDGPVNGEEKPAGLIAAGKEPVLVDCACAAVMGFDYERIPLLSRAFDVSEYGLTSVHTASEIKVVSNDQAFDSERNPLFLKARNLAFAPHFGWKGRIENRT